MAENPYFAPGEPTDLREHEHSTSNLFFLKIGINQGPELNGYSLKSSETFKKSVFLKYEYLSMKWNSSV